MTLHEFFSTHPVFTHEEFVAFLAKDKVRSPKIRDALLLDNATTAAKVGFFLEQHADRLMVEGHHLERLRTHRPREPHYLTPGRRGGRLVSGWNLVVPVDVFEQSSREVV